MRLPELAGVILVTGTDTGVGKTVATAVLAAAATARGQDVVVCKPAQTGLAPGEPGDAAEACRLSGLDAARARELARLPEPLAPTTAARRAGVRLRSTAEVAEQVAGLATEHDLVLVEGSGGVLVGLDGDGAGLLELADALPGPGRFVVVARAGLGSLNHTGLTCRAVRDRGHQVVLLVVGAVPEQPGLAERCTLADLPEAAGTDQVVALPEGLGADPARLHQTVRALLTPAPTRPPKG